MTETGDNFHPSAPRPGLLKRKRRERLLLPLNSILPRRESQRDSDPKPRVARHELPWETAEILHQPQRGCAFGPNERRNPLGVGFPSFLIPRVARASQPWAGGRNPVGIGRSSYTKSCGAQGGLRPASPCESLEPQNGSTRLSLLKRKRRERHAPVPTTGGCTAFNASGFFRVSLRTVTAADWKAARR